MCIEYIPRRARGGHALGACVLIETQRVKKLSPDDAVRSNLGGKSLTSRPVDAQRTSVI